MMTSSPSSEYHEWLAFRIPEAVELIRQYSSANDTNSNDNNYHASTSEREATGTREADNISNMHVSSIPYRIDVKQGSYSEAEKKYTTATAYQQSTEATKQKDTTNSRCGDNINSGRSRELTKPAAALAITRVSDCTAFVIGSVF
jgi:hypothetical protein